METISSGDAANHLSVERKLHAYMLEKVQSTSPENQLLHYILGSEETLKGS